MMRADFIRSNGLGRRRRGFSTVEFAVCLPVMFLLIFGAIEASSFIFLKQSLHVAAYEGARSAMRTGVCNDNVYESVCNILDSRNVKEFVVSFPNGNVSDAETGDEIVIEVTAPTAANSPLTGQFVINREVTARVVMMKE